MRFVKPLTRKCVSFDYRLLWVGLLIYLITAACLLWSWSQAAGQQQQQRAERFGTTIVAQLAALSSESLIVNDRIRLSVLANRLATLPEVDRVSISTVDGQLLVQAGNQNTATGYATFRRPISFENTIAGYVAVTIADNAFQLPISRQIVFPLLFGFAVSVLLILLVNFLPPYLIGVAGEKASGAKQEDPDLDFPMYILVINLFNQISITPKIRHALLENALQQAKDITAVTAAHVEQLPGTGLLLAFDATREQDRCFHVLCTSLLVKNLLNATIRDFVDGRQPEPKFRFGLHSFPGPVSERLEDLRTSEQASDAILLSAIATDDALAVSADVYQLLENKNRIIATRQQLPILDSLITATPGFCYIVRDVAAEYQPLLDGRADLMLTQLVAHQKALRASLQQQAGDAETQSQQFPGT